MFGFVLPLSLLLSPSIVWIFIILGPVIHECSYQCTTKLCFSLGALCTRNRNESMQGNTNSLFPVFLAEAPTREQIPAPLLPSAALCQG